MIEINEFDLPIVVAEKLITATKERTLTDFEKKARKAFGLPDVDVVCCDTFDDADLIEIAHHLLIHCEGITDDMKEKGM